MPSSTFSAALGVACALTCVHAAQAQEPSPKKGGSALWQFSQKVVREGLDGLLDPDIGIALDIESGAPTKVVERIEEECEDGRYRSFQAVVGSAGPSQALPKHLILLVKTFGPKGANDSRPMEGQWLRLKPDGAIVKAFQTKGSVDARDKGIPGSEVEGDLAPDEAQKLLKRELDFWLKGVGLKKLFTEPPLHLAAEKGDLARALSLLAAGAKLDERDARGWTALTHAAAGGHAALVKELVKAGADVNAAAKDKTTPLLAAAVLLRLEVVELLLASNAERNLRDSSGDTALMKVCTPEAPTRPQAALTRIGLSLLKAGADPNAPNLRGWTPLISAAAAGNEALVKALLAAGSDPRARLPNGRSALFFAKGGPKPRIARMLREAGASE